MALPGIGITPPSGSALTELTAITRRGFMPKLTVQLYKSSPLCASLLSNAKMMSGGISPITVPVQVNAMTSGQWVGYDGQFTMPSQINGITTAEYAPKAFSVPIPFLGMEAAVQVDYAIIPRIEAVMNDAGNTMNNTFAQAFYGNVNNPQAFNGLQAGIDDGTNATVFGNISRTATPVWKARVINANGANLTRQLAAQYINIITNDCSERPTYGLTDFGTWSVLQQDFIGQESYQNTTASSGFGNSAESSFTALNISGVPIYPDPFCGQASPGTLYLNNSKYMNMFLHENAAFSLSDFETLISNGQIGWIAVMLTIGELVFTKPSTMARIYNLNRAF